VKKLRILKPSKQGLNHGLTHQRGKCRDILGLHTQVASFHSA